MKNYNFGTKVGVVIQLLCAVVMVGCGKSVDKTHVSLNGMDQLTEEQSLIVRAAVLKFNSLLNNEITVDEANAYSVKVVILPQEQMNDQSNIPNTFFGTQVMGHAKVGDSDCEISFSEERMHAKSSDQMISVVLHELGHCLGLSHVQEVGHIMSSTAAPFSQLNAEAQKRYADNVRSIVR